MSAFEASASSGSAEASAGEREITLVSADGEEFRVPLKNVKISKLIMEMIGSEEDTDEVQAPLPAVKSADLSKVLEYCRHYVEDPMTEFVKVSRCKLFYSIV